MTDLGLLGPIVAAKRTELGERLGDMPIEELRAKARPTTRSLKAALDRPGGRFIFEYKRASPSEGPLNASADPVAIARAYSGVADAMSVLVDPHFQGSYADLRAARAAFDGPILAKDFVVDPRQVVEARLAGADAVLAILAVLDDRAVSEVMTEAARFRMDVLVEVHDETEIRRAIALGAPLIGINNRNLKSFRTDLSVTERLSPLAQGRTLVAESGIATRADIDRLSPLVDAFLVGSTPMRDPDPRLAARALAFGRVKLCGLRTADDLIAAAPAAYAGLLFVPESPRSVTLAQAEALSGPKAPPFVGVFRDAPLETVVDAASRVPFAAIQLHGAEGIAYVAALRKAFAGEIWLAQHPADPPRAGGDRLLFDNRGGGTGEPFDWSALAGHPGLGRAMIAGGIGAHNARAARALGAFGIDVGSATDAAPGIKDHSKIAALFDALRTVSRKERLRICA
ncbi:bifunctional indole-3-glycerol-phosphate synthase TrpC/phosphoribosylanthranilate isomerase TrpF [Sphingomonas sp. HDW15A]|uniref:bifunctional indole-3-glycerol-phosphate synthase TrpC/phosphoribosylanthranilate isomerase TrpF n=1 Tax=Sphingomonas sp. HDW15A TaxID=2714942 RepID=UPI00140CE6C2|nr:bifunctional indole-3-glycerol-phosphate synthase TrpC/phosphoribosylanthranilate isomerase TrpF [Sphingomonas sp. HDW15A]QIK95286.1 bifunctional indole-3-glycerol-phosphate synthase TrpC/phosphoribosylanthranilate isomerase TrpF [Sphingomonas sp. HDW15A]